MRRPSGVDSGGPGHIIYLHQQLRYRPASERSPVTDDTERGLFSPFRRAPGNCIVSSDARDALPNHRHHVALEQGASIDITRMQRMES